MIKTYKLKWFQFKYDIVNWMRVCKLTKNRLDHRRFPVILQKQSKQQPERKYIHMMFIYFTILIPSFLPDNVRITELSTFSTLDIYSPPSTSTNIDMLVLATLLKKVQKRCFTVNFAKPFKNTFFTNYPEHLRWLPL